MTYSELLNKYSGASLRLHINTTYSEAERIKFDIPIEFAIFRIENERIRVYARFNSEDEWETPYNYNPIILELMKRLSGEIKF